MARNELGQELRLTKHGNKRFNERVDCTLSNEDKLAMAWAGDPNFKFIWTPDRNGHDWRLRTVLKANWNCNLADGDIVK